MLEKNLIFRPSPSPAEGVPLGVRSVGWHRGCTRHEENRNKRQTLFLWCTHGEGFAEFPDSPSALSINPGMALCYGREDETHYRFPPQKFWRFRWATLDGPLAPGLFKSFGLPHMPFAVGDCPEKLFDALEKSVGGGHASREREAGALIYRILSYAADKCRHTQDGNEMLKNEIEDYIHKNLADPDMCVERLATRFGMHRVTVTRQFKAKHGVAPATFLHRIRIRKSISLLLETDEAITTIAKHCGFRDPNYFTRAFHKAMGLTPRQFRQQH